MLRSLLLVVFHSTLWNCARSLSLSSFNRSSKYSFDTIFLDCDGTICDTELVTLEAFNEAFKARNIEVEWSIEVYKELLKVGNSPQRIKHYFDATEWPGHKFKSKDKVPLAYKEGLAKSLQQEKNECFQKVWKRLAQDCKLRPRFNSSIYQLWIQFFSISDTANPSFRPGIKKLVDDCIDNNINIAVVSNSNFKMVDAVVKTVFGEKRSKAIPIFSSDINVPKKPSPDLYLFAARHFQAESNRCFVIEDSNMGLAAAIAANMKTLVTMSTFTREENFDGAELVVEDLESLPSNQELSLEFIDSLNKK
jgi:beta-phosphoglucomutase-like phosphatase (HAD superfamily)